jgi:peroxiredoxin
MPKLQERLDEFKKSFESGAPPYNAPHEAIETMHRATAELRATGIEERALKVGDHAPGFTLFNQEHVEVSSANLLRKGPMVVSFFRGHWWPYCNMELEALQEIHSEVRELGAEIVVITPELERYTRALHKKLNLTFDILTDLHLKIAEQFQLVFTLPNYLRDLYKSFGSTLDRFNDEPEYRLPVPARYIIDKGGIIRAADVNADYTIRSEPAETLNRLRTLTTSTGN